jgi:hypothetical protein
MNLYGYIAQMSNIPFTPVPRQRSRHDGWTAERQVAFIDALAGCGIVCAAAQKVGKSPTSAYRLKLAEGAESFSAAWDEALGIGMMRLQDIAMDRAINGVAVPHFYKGEQVGETRWYDNRLLTFMLRHTNPRLFGRYAAEEEQARRAEREQAEAEARRLDQLTRAEALLAATEAELDTLEPGARADEGDEARVHRHEWTQRKERLISIIAQLRQVDTAREAEASIDALVASGRYSARHGAIFKQRLRAAGP